MRERNYGIDLLRIVSMVYVITLHVLGQGGVLQNCISGTIFYRLAWFFEIFVFCAVDCFALISGYVSYRDDTISLKLSNYLNTWLQVVFYGLIITAAYNLLMPENVVWTSYIKAFLPVSMNSYWYFSAYTGLFFISPIINIAVQKTDHNKLNKSVYILIGIFSVFATFSNIFTDTFSLKGGYSFVWLAVLYYVGAVMKKTGIFSNIKMSRGVVYLLLLALFGELWKEFSWVITTLVFGRDALPDLFMSYISPTVVAAAVIHVSLFAKMKLSSGMMKFVKFAAPGAFAAYIINCQFYVWNFYMKGKFIFLSSVSLYTVPFIVIGFSLIFVLAAVSVDYLRRMLFRIMKINSLAICIESKVNTILEGL